jgi:hypothetical protein
VGDRTVCMYVTDHGRGVEGMEDIMESVNATVKQFLPLNTKNAPNHWLLSFNFPNHHRHSILSSAFRLKFSNVFFSLIMQLFLRLVVVLYILIENSL